MLVERLECFWAMSSSSTKKVSSRSSTEVQLIDIDEKNKVILRKRLTEAQGFKVNSKTIFQDNASTIKLTKK